MVSLHNLIDNSFSVLHFNSYHGFKGFLFCSTPHRREHETDPNYSLYLHFSFRTVASLVRHSAGYTFSRSRSFYLQLKETKRASRTLFYSFYLVFTFQAVDSSLTHFAVYPFTRIRSSSLQLTKTKEEPHKHLLFLSFTLQSPSR